MPPKLQERDFAGTPYIPVYVMLPVSILIIPTLSPFYLHFLSQRQKCLICAQFTFFQCRFVDNYCYFLFIKKNYLFFWANLSTKRYFIFLL